jgi:hypothetical protein
VTATEFPFTLDRVKGGWQVYDTERHEHIGRVWARLAYAEQALDTLRNKRPPIVRFILGGSTHLHDEVADALTPDSLR